MDTDSLIDEALELSPYPLARGTLEYLAERLAELQPVATAETGCGASTLVFSRFSRSHTVFSFDEFGVFDRVRNSSSLGGAEIEFVGGPTQETLPGHRFVGELDAVLIDGPHAYPFPDVEYFHFYPRIRADGMLIVDDLQIRTVHNLFKFLRQDVMFDLEAVVHQTAFFRRTAAPAFPSDGDGWAEQGYNRTELLRYTWRERLRRYAPESIRKLVRLARGSRR